MTRLATYAFVASSVKVPGMVGGAIQSGCSSRRSMRQPPSIAAVTISPKVQAR